MSREFNTDEIMAFPPDMSNPEFVREYEFKDGLCVRCRSNCCLFCSYYTDIYYDWHGPYAIICEKKIPDGFVTGMSGKCKSFCDINNNKKNLKLVK